VAIITNTTTVTAFTPTTWEIPGNIDRSQIPRGMITYQGVIPVAALLTSNTLSFRIILTMPINYFFALKSFYVSMQSDDGSIGFDNAGSITFGQAGSDVQQMILSRGIDFEYSNLRAHKSYALDAVGPYAFLDGSGGDAFTVVLSDTSGGDESAGDVSYVISFYQFDVEQMNKYAINTSMPVIRY